MWSKVKKSIYNVVATSGMWVLHRLFPEYFGTDPIDPTDRFIEYPWALNQINNFSRDVHILDVGCAGSMFPMLLYAIGFKIWGIDVRDMNCDILNFIKGNICECKIQSESFHIITAISTVEHIGISRYAGDYTDFSAINEIHRLLKPGGTFLMTVPFADEYREETFHRVYDKERLRDLLQSFSVVGWDCIKSPEANYHIALIQATK
jgi:SAM-dependent methyltransferase